MIPDRVRAWAQEHLPAPITSVTPVGGGLTDTIYLLEPEGSAPVVLRHVPIHTWGEIGRRHVASEALGCELMAGAGLPVPALLASDPTGADAGDYVNLTSWLPGTVRLDPLSPYAIDVLARAALVVHRTPVPTGQRPPAYAFWTPDHLAVPSWARQPKLWERAISLFEQGPPDTPSGLVHRDFHPGNVLWDGDEITGIIDWAETSWGPPDLDVVHSATNFAILHDPAGAEAFRTAYVRAGGVLDRDPDAVRFWVVSDVLGFLPDPMFFIAALIAPRPDLTPGVLHARLERRLESALR